MPRVKRGLPSPRFPHARSGRRRPPRSRIAPYTARGGSEPDVDCGRSIHRFRTAAWEELVLWFPSTMLNALEQTMWEFYDRLAGSRDLAPARRRRPMEQSRRRGGRKSLPPINRSPVSARGTHETEPCWSGLCGRPRNEAREVILCPAVSRRMQDLIKSAMSGRPNELLRRRRLAPRPRA